MEHGSNQLTLTILFHLWHLLVIQSCTLLVSLVKVVVLLSFSIIPEIQTFPLSQLHLLPLSAATALANSLVSTNLTTAIPFTPASHKQISTYFKAFRTLQNINTSNKH